MQITEECCYTDYEVMRSQLNTCTLKNRQSVFTKFFCRKSILANISRRSAIAQKGRHASAQACISGNTCSWAWKCRLKAKFPQIITWHVLTIDSNCLLPMRSSVALKSTISRIFLICCIPPIAIHQNYNGKSELVECAQHLEIQLNRNRTRNRKHRRAAAKPAACAEPLMLSTLGSKGKRGGRVR